MLYPEKLCWMLPERMDTEWFPQVSWEMTWQWWRLPRMTRQNTRGSQVAAVALRQVTRGPWLRAKLIKRKIPGPQIWSVRKPWVQQSNAIPMPFQCPEISEMPLVLVDDQRRHRMMPDEVSIHDTVRSTTYASIVLETWTVFEAIAYTYQIQVWYSDITQPHVSSLQALLCKLPWPMIRPRFLEHWVSTIHKVLRLAGQVKMCSECGALQNKSYRPTSDPQHTTCTSMYQSISNTLECSK